jgi:hypothetical protein
MYFCYQIVQKYNHIFFFFFFFFLEKTVSESQHKKKYDFRPELVVVEEGVMLKEHQPISTPNYGVLPFQ